ncbi:receptor-type tyrosine-protein phosphatase N2-like isoform X2 [Mercenaria mercenaria]|uniref:receptor-type tyrosine-protein phosphatase N2-like isoform X2 n=1 Tax=Mercenaria mercenaria TaxID=6596 RepID=UPI00234E6038|nr:receptor-type tyrosine-protein phosphatase N2-like isoform X2 [Mercenaria mercenaria]
MWNKYYAILSGILLSICVGNCPCLALQIDRQFPLGTIGCLFTNTQELCEAGATCIDDLLFGTCSDSGIPANFDYTLRKHDLKKLQNEILKLVQDGFSWHDGYTQCIIQNVIISLTIKEPFSKKICYELLFDWKNPVEDEITSVLESLYDRTAGIDRLTPADQYEPVSLLSPSQKRDEIVRVHKYFDKNEKIHKRNFWDPPVGLSNYLSYYPRDDVLQYYPSLYQQNYKLPNRGGWEDSGISYDDIQLVKDYLQATRRKQRYSSKLSDLFSLSHDLQQQSPQQVEGFPEYDLPDRGYDFQEEDLEPGYVWNDNGMIYEVSTPDNGQEQLDLVEVAGPPVEETEEIQSLPPSLANTLDKLIQGDITPENLTDVELEYFTPYVSNMLLRLNDVDDKIPMVDEPEAWNDIPVEENMMQGAEERPYGIDEEEMMRDVSGDTDDALPVEDDLANIVQDEVDRQYFEKKSDTDNTEKAVKREDVVDTNFAFIEMDQNLTKNTKDKLIDALQKVVTANPGSLNNYEVNGTKLKINVDPILAGLNASRVAEQAREHQTELEKATGLKFIKSGIGNVTEVEWKGNDDRYFVLTFVLCGCIAGILLAVVVIYLIRRNSRSKEKLQQITAAQEGNEAASKDYQDLCRQRMQSKSSEKPEPLHTAAVSRVGSVSESQVRSPSSRSSTSSWSEEPVNSNMDISTGHIVLSYMEDHLKNKDRLEREWEAMCAYEADPCSTKVGEDNGNARKNRYADVLPYDHSRVVLTTNTNVSGADYINASTITDHDPRNPAYVATQGPLPHTVADFWQMVWEQGSVVIVMLTKLTENGEAKCHRYWPDEGSDLYHIYEVHLVSEHIWCEDYLVRSFYLKNLQTGETRTVTQFHFLTWPDLGIPGSIKALLDFRRKVNKSYRGRSCPIVVHCSDGCGRTGTYCLIDMVLNRMAKGAKEIDIAATLEHIRDQRTSMVKTKEQFQFALAAVAEEVHAILKALPQ